MGNIIFNNVKINKTKKDIGLDIDNLTIPCDSMIAVVGSRTCGKSNFLGVLSGKIHPQSGSVTFEDGALNKGDLFICTAKTYLSGFDTVKDIVEKTSK